MCLTHLQYFRHRESIKSYDILVYILKWLVGFLVLLARRGWAELWVWRVLEIRGVGWLVEGGWDCGLAFFHDGEHGF